MESPRPRVHIGLPTYNRRDRLARAIESVLAQTHTDLELIISDNASTDGTEELCREVAARDPRVRYVRHAANRGSTENFNFLFAELRDEYVMVLGDDDWIDPGYVEACLDVLLAHPDTAVVVGRSSYYSADGSYHDELADPPEMLDEDPAQRVRDYYRVEPKGETFYGLWRGAALAASAPMRNELYNDGVFAATLVFEGKLRATRAVAVHRARGGTSEDWPKLLRTLGKPAIQARFPQLVIFVNVFSDIAWGHPAYRKLPLARRVRLAFDCAWITFSFRGLAFSLFGPAIANLGARPGMRWMPRALASARRRWGVGEQS
ncbi:glycosyltransferase family 2 protein [Solirubrobacter soli]|uniref:glycosyltransferase family 2 protein n=1 Tax=Solirubrobacter soli TaxID=363832 RepID=UPI000422A568|nr:glycosyltransferase family 2 protein [Solirubrobacter soli]